MISTQRSLRDPAADDAAVVEQVDPVLDARQAVGDLPEVALAELLLAVEVERAVVGRDDLEVVLDEARPELGLVVGRAERRRADELRALEAVAHVVEREEQVLRARLGERLRAAVAGLADRVEGVARREVDDVDRHAGGLGEADHAVRRLALEDRVAGDAVVVAGRSCPRRRGRAATTSIASPFSACIMISPPFFAVCCIARKIAPSSL